MGDRKKPLDLTAYFKSANVDGNEVASLLEEATKLFPFDEFVISCALYYDTMDSLTRKQFAALRSKVLSRKINQGTLDIKSFLKPRPKPPQGVMRKIQIVRGENE